MNDDHTSKFKVSFDEESSDTVLQEEVKDAQISKLSRRITLVALLAPVLAAAMVFFVYHDIRNNLLKDRDAGITKVRDLSVDVDTRLSNLSSQLTKLEKSLNTTVVAFEKSVTGLKAELQKSEKQIQKLDAGKLNKKDRPNVKAQVKKAMSPALQNLKKLDADLTKKMGEFKGDFVALENDIKKIKSDVSALSSRKIDKATLDLEFLKEKKNNQARFEKMSKELDERIKGFEKKMNQLSKSTKTSRKPKTTPKAKTSQVKKTPPAKDGIVEEQISE